MFERFPTHFQQQALLRVKTDGFPRRNPEKPGIELFDVFEKATGPYVHLAVRFRIRIVIALDIPARRLNLGNGVDALSQKVPVLFRSISAARKAARHADDGNRLALLSL